MHHGVVAVLGQTVRAVRAQLQVVVENAFGDAGDERVAVGVAGGGLEVGAAVPGVGDGVERGQRPFAQLRGAGPAAAEERQRGKEKDADRYAHVISLAWFMRSRAGSS